MAKRDNKAAPRASGSEVPLVLDPATSAVEESTNAESTVETVEEAEQPTGATEPTAEQPSAVEESSDAESTVQPGAETEPSRDVVDADGELVCPGCQALDGRRPCSVECWVKAGYKAENYHAEWAEEDRAPPVTPGFARCRVISPLRCNGKDYAEGHEGEFPEDIAASCAARLTFTSGAAVPARIRQPSSTLTSPKARP